MTHSAYKASERQKGRLQLGEETMSFLKRKIGRLFPYFIFAYFISVMVQIALYPMTNTQQLAEKLFFSIWEILLLHRSGVFFNSWVGGDWYISAMIIGMLFIYPFLRKYLRTYSNVVAPCVVIFYIGYFSNKYGYIHVTDGWNGFVYDSVIRAVGDMNLGIAVYAVSEKLGAVSFTRFGRRVLSICACMGYASVLITVFLTSWGQMDYIWLLCIAVSVAITGSEAGSLCQWINTLNTKVFSFLL